MKKLIHRIMLLLMMIFLNDVTAQDRTVSGAIIDEEDAQPLAGVSVLVKSTSVGTTTDSDGKFTLNLPPGKNQLEIS
jgi:iron complex outermembrane receptor protein